MGAWGEKPFENDSTLNWTDKLTNKNLADPLKYDLFTKVYHAFDPKPVKRAAAYIATKTLTDKITETIAKETNYEPDSLNFLIDYKLDLIENLPIYKQYLKEILEDKQWIGYWTDQAKIVELLKQELKEINFLIQKYKPRN